MRVHGSPTLPLWSQSSGREGVMQMSDRFEPGSDLWDMPDAVHCHTEPLVSAPLCRTELKLGTFFKVLQPVSVHVHIQFEPGSL